MSYIQIRTVDEVGALLRDARKRARLDQATLAERLGVSRKWVVEAERGNAGASLGIVLRALDLVGVRLAFATPEDPPKRSSRTRSTARTIDIDEIVDAARKRRR